MSVAYLDTNHISALVRQATRPEVQQWLECLRSGDAQLMLSFFHLLELCDASFVDRPAVGALLDELPVVWAANLHVVQDMEIDNAVRKSLGLMPVPLTVFGDDFCVVMKAPREALIPVSDMLEALSERPEFRDQLRDAGEYGVQGDRMMKRRAAAVRAPEEPILARLRTLDFTETPGGVALPRPLDAREVLDAGGGLEGFPAYHVMQALAITRLRDAAFPTDPNDIIDEWHACYSPYTDVTVLDRGTVGRCRSAGLPHIDRITSRLSEALGILGLS